MAFFKFRARGQKGEEQAVSPAESVDAMRRRARHRLIGATVLVLLGVVGFPLLFDSQPRSIPVDIPVVIPDRSKTKPLGQAAGGRVAEAPPAAATGPAPASEPAVAGLDPKEEVVAHSGTAKPVPPAAPEATRPEPKPEPKAEPKPEARVEAKAEAKAAPAEPKESPKPAARPDDGAKARALLEARDDKGAVPQEAGRFVVQVGAFADADKAHEARMRVERAGLKTYTQVVETKEGKRIRVRVGPYAQRTEADKVAGKIKSLDLPASILAL